MRDELRDNLFFNKVTIIGVGLMGASFALALREKGLCGNICGYGRKEDNLRRAKDSGIIDDYTLNVCSACEGSDLIVLATPIGVFREIAGNIRDTIKRGTLVTDVGSVKGRLVYELESLLSPAAYYIGSHPIAGSDKSGIDDASAELFNNARCIITPTENSDESSKNQIVSIWERFGARIELMDPFVHDEIYAVVSHFPHIIAYAIINTVGDVDSKYIEYAGQGLKDTTRIALSSPELWRDISILNRENIVKLMNIFRDNLERIEVYLKEADSHGIEGEFLKAQKLRKGLK